MKSSKSGNTASGHGSKDGIASLNDPVGQRLRDFFSALENEGIPDRFLDLLDQLDAAESAAAKASATTTLDGAKDGS